MENKKPLILIVDDEPDLRKLMASKLAEEGFEIIQEEDGASALSRVQVQKPDLILLDIRMPGMNGFEVLKKLRASNEWGAKVPVFFLTNLLPDDDSTLKEIEFTEPAYYLMKDVTSVGDIAVKIRERLGS